MDQAEQNLEVRGCQAPRASIATPKLKAPAGSTDCHFHIFGPHARYGLSPGRSYTPPEALVEQYLALAAPPGLERMVVVQPSIYGTDNACTLDAVALRPGTRTGGGGDRRSGGAASLRSAGTCSSTCTASSSRS